jgi:hypothetical protein
VEVRRRQTEHEEGDAMGADDKIKNKAEELAARARSRSAGPRTTRSSKPRAAPTRTSPT